MRDALVVDQEERLVLEDRTADDEPGLLLIQLGLRPRLVGSKKFLASSLSLRMNPNADPWKAFVPDLLTMLIWLELNPYSAE